MDGPGVGEHPSPNESVLETEIEHRKGNKPADQELDNLSRGGFRNERRRTCRGGPRRMALGRRLKNARVGRGISMAEAARQLGVAHSAYRMWELGVAKPDANRWRTLSEWLGVPIVTLLREEGILTKDDEKNLLGTERKIVGLPRSEIEAIEADEGRAFFEDVEELVDRMVREGLIDDDEAATTLSRLERVKRAYGVPGHTAGRGGKRSARAR